MSGLAQAKNKRACKNADLKFGKDTNQLSQSSKFFGDSFTNQLTYAHKIRIIFLSEVVRLKRRDLIKLLEKNGWTLIRNGGNHDVYFKNGMMEVIPRHEEINEMLAKSIIRRNDLK